MADITKKQQKETMQYNRKTKKMKDLSILLFLIKLEVQKKFV